MEHGTSDSEHEEKTSARKPRRSASDELIAAGYAAVRPDEEGIPSATSVAEERLRDLTVDLEAPQEPLPPEIARLERTRAERPRPRPRPPSRVAASTVPRPESATPPSLHTPSRSRAAGLAIFIVSLLVAIAVLIALLVTAENDGAAGDATGPGVTVVERVTTEIVNAEDPISTAAAVARAVIPSIVTVEIGEETEGGFTTRGSGSGVVWSSDGLVVTNEHVIRDTPAVRVILADGRIYTAEVVGTDAYTDLAVLSIGATGLPAIQIGSTTDLAIGDGAIAVGNPLGLEGGPSLTVGVISAFDREVQTGPDEFLFGMIQTDAPITRGSSGGALVDTEGRLIGITSAVGISDVGIEGIGFAIPIELVGRVVADLVEVGRARHAFLGVGGETSFTVIEDGAHIPAGVRIREIVAGSAAESAGIQIDDVVTAVDGERVTTMDRLILALREFSVGEEVTVSINRDGTDVDLTVSLGERPQATS